MYLEHFGLAEEPFSVTSDPRFLFLSESHEEALAHLMYCVEYRKGFAAITGEIGTGKTMLLNTLISRLGERISVAFVYQSAGTTVELMRYVFKDLGLEADSFDKTDLLSRFNDYLIAEQNAGRDVVLVVDEAQNLAIEVLEDLRLISNFEAGNRKLIQIILAGQTELGIKLRLPELRQLNQRISIQFVLKALGAGETGSYIQHRLKIAGAQALDIFSPAAIKLIYGASSGVPRVINQICDTSMVRAAVLRKPVIEPAQVRHVLKEDFQFRGEAGAQGNTASSAKKSKFGLVAGVAVLLVLALGSGWLLGRTGHQVPGNSVLVEEAIAHEAANPVETVAGIEPAPELQESVTLMTTEETPTATYAVSKAAPAQSSLQPQAGSTETESDAATKGFQKSDPVRNTATTDIQESNFKIQPGDRLSALIERQYGFVTWELLELVLEYNPQIHDPNLILVGQRLKLPKVDEEQLARLRAGTKL